jgi:manganese transport protein
MYPLIRLTSRRDLMGDLVNRWWVSALAWLLFVTISAANVWLVWQVFAE